MKCPHCDLPVEPRKSPKAAEEPVSNLVEQAINQAKVVDKFGEVLQVVGYLFIALFSLGLIYSLFTESWVQLIIFLIAIPATFISYNVFGSALRAMSLYIQVRVK